MVNIYFANLSCTIIVLFFLSVISLAFYLERLFLLIKLSSRSLLEFKTIDGLAAEFIDQKSNDRQQNNFQKELIKKSSELLSPQTASRVKAMDSLVFNYNIEFDGFIESIKISIMKLGSIAALAPYIGLFGTVLGIMDSFSDIAKTGTSNFAYVSKGISEALIATAAGLLLAVTASFFYNHLLAKIKNLQNTKDIAIEKVNHIISRSDGNA